MQKFTFNINNSRVLTMKQLEHDGSISINTSTKEHYAISPGEMIMLLNYFQNCKNGTEKSVYILQD